MYKINFKDFPWADWFEEEDYFPNGYLKMGRIIEIGANITCSVFPMRESECIEIEVYL